MTWSWSSAPVQYAGISASAMLLAGLGLLVLLRRGHWLTTLLVSSAFLSIAAFQAGTLGLIQAESAHVARTWATYLARVSALVSWLWLTLSLVLGRPEPRPSLSHAAPSLVLALAGCVALFGTAHTPAFIERVLGAGPSALVVFGPLGKLYLMYLVVVMVAVLMNLENMLRKAPASSEAQLRPLFLAILVAVLAELLVVSAGLLRGGMPVGGLAAAAPVLFVSGAAAMLALARRRLSDMSVPVARPVVYYSSVSLTLAGLFLLAMAVLSRLVPAMSSQSKQVVTIAFLAFVGGGALLLLVSPRTGRAIRRFIDRNFYANRYDYRREWERVSATLVPTARLEEQARQVETLVRSVFDADRVGLHLRDQAAGPLRRLLGGRGVPHEIAADHALVRHLARVGHPVLFRDMEGDLDLIPLLVESREAIESTGAQVCAPLAVGDDVLGLMWLSGKRAGDSWTSEDLEFLAAMSRQIAAALWFARQAERLAESRQLESLHRLSSFVLHDIKNQVSGLSLVVENAGRHMSNPEFVRDAFGVVERTVASLRELMSQVSSLAHRPIVSLAPCSLRAVVDEALTASGLAVGPGPPVAVSLEVCDGDMVLLDRRMMTRVLVNLLTNAREALTGDGHIRVSAGTEASDGRRAVRFVVQDDGRGMSDEFLRRELYQPFATTKANGLGVGLAQCRSIVEAHGGRIEVTSRRGEGSTFIVHIPIAAAVPASPAVGAGERA